MDYQFVNYRGLDDLGRAVQHIALQVPPSVERVVGVPRSGMLAASVLALQLNLPFTDVDGYLAGRVLATGRRAHRPANGSGPRTIVIDDSVLTGTQLAAVRAAIASAGNGREALDEVLYAALFVTTTSRHLVDYFGEVVEPPRIFAWNILHHAPLMARACLDIDGVLCHDPTEDENDDGVGYEAFLAGAQPLFVPTAPVGYLVTSRLERYRPQTERWLAEHGIRYGELIMLKGMSAGQRRAAGAHGAHKADAYRRSGAQLFIESDYGQAVEIAHRSGRQVFAIDRREMVYPPPGRALAAAPGAFLRSIGRVPPAHAAYLETRTRLSRAVGPRPKALIRRALGR